MATATPINCITKQDLMEFVQNPDLDNYQRFALKSAIYPGKGTPFGLIYVALKGSGEAGEFAEHVGKAMRDDGMIVQEDIGDDTPYFFGVAPRAERRES
jgi:hypothetical protein